MSQTTVLIISQGKLNADEFNRNDYHLPIEVIDLNIAEQSYDLSEETVKNTNEGDNCNNKKNKKL